MDDIQLFTEDELIKELSSRHNRLLVIRPGKKDISILNIYCKTEIPSGGDAPNELFIALGMIYDSINTLIRDSFCNIENFREIDDED